MYSIRLLSPAVRELERLDKSVARRIVDRINWLATNLDELRPEAYTGDLSGLYKLRIGNYRAIYQILNDEKVIIIHLIGHRREIYR
ncbi:MAG: type II toxin-antitoxin system RelE family toxin [Anaerolineales bacterium]